MGAYILLNCFSLWRFSSYKFCCRFDSRAVGSFVISTVWETRLLAESATLWMPNFDWEQSTCTKAFADYFRACTGRYWWRPFRSNLFRTVSALYARWIPGIKEAARFAVVIIVNIFCSSQDLMQILLHAILLIVIELKLFCDVENLKSFRCAKEHQDIDTG